MWIVQYLLSDQSIYCRRRGSLVQRFRLFLGQCKVYFLSGPSIDTGVVFSPRGSPRFRLFFGTVYSVLTEWLEHLRRGIFLQRFRLFFGTVWIEQYLLSDPSTDARLEFYRDSDYFWDSVYRTVLTEWPERRRQESLFLHTRHPTTPPQSLTKIKNVNNFCFY